MKRETKKTIVGIVGAGGREHVLAEAYAKSTHVDEMVVVPGNDFIKQDIEKRFKKPVRIYPGVKLTDTETIVSILKKETVTLADVAQDNAIAANVAGRMRELGFPAVGPDALGSRIESDKAWFREHAKAWGVPQPSYAVFESAAAAIDWINQQTEKPFYIKAAFLAEGKGVVSANNKKEAVEQVKKLVEKFPQAAKKIVLEEWMRHENGAQGDEFSTFFITDGRDYKLVGSAVDYKRVFDGDRGENTGSMGSNSPTNLLTPELISFVENEIAERIITGLGKEGIVYKGIMYISGIVLRKNDGSEEVKVVETNARWGDPEAQVIIPSIKNDFFELNMAIATGNLGDINLQTDKKFRVAVAGTAKGYPLDYTAVKGKEVFGIEQVQKMFGVTVYGAGLKIRDEKYFVNGGRVFYVMGEGKTLSEAREKAYLAMSEISIDGENLQYRTDIGGRDSKRNPK